VGEVPVVAAGAFVGVNPLAGAEGIFSGAPQGAASRKIGDLSGADGWLFQIGLAKTETKLLHSLISFRNSRASSMVISSSAA
jgi:hypothetical protein